jgi:hypothetical protein
MPANAGIQVRPFLGKCRKTWIPACAGMTKGKMSIAGEQNQNPSAWS